MPDATVLAPAAEGLSGELDVNLDRLSRIFYAEHNADLKVLRWELPDRTRAAFVYFASLAAEEQLSLAQLEEATAALRFASADRSASRPLSVGGREAELTRRWPDATAGLLRGRSFLLLDGAACGLLVGQAGWEQRDVGSPHWDVTGRGPQEAFNESLVNNLALVRARLPVPELVAESLEVGIRSRTRVYVLYLKDVANPRLVAEVKRRIAGVSVDVITDSGQLEQFIEDAPHALFPQIIASERPDRTAAYLSEGHVAMLVDRSPTSLLIPGTIFDAFTDTQDYYIRWPYATLLRSARLFGALVTVLLPPLYLAVIVYQPELLSGRAHELVRLAHEGLLPPVAAVLVAEIAFEIVREAGMRIGSVLGIMGALLLSSLAFKGPATDWLLSPTLFTFVAISVVARFTVPNRGAIYALRLLRIALILATTFFGFFGLTLVLFAFAGHLLSLRSFGVPLVPSLGRNHAGLAGDSIWRMPLWAMPRRPTFLSPLDELRQTRKARRWQEDQP